MPHITRSIVVRRPRQAVWDYVENVENTPRWNPMFVHQEVVGGDVVAPGATIRSVARMAGRRIVAETVVTEFEAPHRSTLVAEQPMRATGSYLLEDVSGGTLFTWHMDAEPGLGRAFGVLSDPVVVVAVGLQLRRAMRRLKRQLEHSEDLAPQPT